MDTDYGPSGLIITDLRRAPSAIFDKLEELSGSGWTLDTPSHIYDDEGNHVASVTNRGVLTGAPKILHDAP